MSPKKTDSTMSVLASPPATSLQNCTRTQLSRSCCVRTNASELIVDSVAAVAAAVEAEVDEANNDAGGLHARRDEEAAEAAAVEVVAVIDVTERRLRIERR